MVIRVVKQQNFPTLIGSADSHAAAMFRMTWSLLVRERPSEHLLGFWEDYLGYVDDKIA